MINSVKAEDLKEIPKKEIETDEGMDEEIPDY
jgi:hypothetical protein